jgi:predicted RNase H-related nuclease YkuK (DUF458 family)
MSIVANCHKVPQKNFEKHLLSIDVIQKVLNTIYLIQSKSGGKSCFTVSPVRHIKTVLLKISKVTHLISAFA